MSTGKRRRKEPIRDSSDSDEGDDSIYDLNWEPEKGSVFKVPLHEFYNTLSEIPERFKDARDWTTERHQIESPKRAPQEIAQGRLPQSDLPQ
jgi:hypothetical protein